MLVDYTNQRRAAGETIRTANSGESRSFASNLDYHCMVFGMFPIALASGAGAMEKRFGLGIIEV
jgi:HAE1 family hydrophobic/amphiphilic exporter-1